MGNSMQDAIGTLQAVYTSLREMQASAEDGNVTSFDVYGWAKADADAIERRLIALGAEVPYTQEDDDDDEE